MVYGERTIEGVDPPAAGRRSRLGHVHQKVGSSTPYFGTVAARMPTAAEGHQAGLRVARSTSSSTRTTTPARVDRLVRREGAGPPRRALGGGDLRRLGLHAHGRAGLPRPLLPRGVRRPGRRLLLQPRARRGDHQVQLRRPGDGRGRAHRHGHPAGVPVRHRGAEAGVPGARDQGREDLLPGHHRARRRLGRGGHQDARRARRRRLGDQRLEDLHHQRPPRGLHRARDQDRPRQGLRRLHALPRRRWTRPA